MEKMEIEKTEEIIDPRDLDHIESHNMRRKRIKDSLRAQKIVKTNHNGKRRMTNALREMNHKEVNYGVWLDRVTKSQEVGRKIMEINEEKFYNQRVAYLEEREEKKKEFMVEFYGEKEGNARYDAHLKNISSELEAKYSVK